MEKSKRTDYFRLRLRRQIKKNEENGVSNLQPIHLHLHLHFDPWK